MNKIVHDIALQVGGSHYPSVGGQLLEKSIFEAVNRCIAIAENNDGQVVADKITEYFYGPPQQ